MSEFAIFLIGMGFGVAIGMAVTSVYFWWWYNNRPYYSEGD